MKKTSIVLVSSGHKVELRVVQQASANTVGRMISHPLSQREIKHLVKTLAGLMR